MHLDRVMTILENVAIAGRAVTAAEVQAATGLPRPTCYRLLQTMAGQALLEEPEPGRYLVGERLIRLAARTLGRRIPPKFDRHSRENDRNIPS